MRRQMPDSIHRLLSNQGVELPAGIELSEGPLPSSGDGIVHKDWDIVINITVDLTLNAATIAAIGGSVVGIVLALSKYLKDRAQETTGVTVDYIDDVRAGRVLAEGPKPVQPGQQLEAVLDKRLKKGKDLFLKDDRIVNALFLKRPERIEALGLIVLISLLIWRLIEHVMRTELQAGETTVPGWGDKPTCRPSAYMLTWKFRGVMILCIGHTRLLAQPLSQTQKAFLKALKMPEHRFIQPCTSG